MTNLLLCNSLCISCDSGKDTSGLILPKDFPPWLYTLSTNHPINIFRPWKLFHKAVTRCNGGDALKAASLFRDKKQQQLSHKNNLTTATQHNYTIRSGPAIPTALSTL